MIKQKKRTYIFDFDSTITSVEALDLLAEISLENTPNKTVSLERIKDITNKGINGEIKFSESLKQRIEMINAKKQDLEPLIEILKKKVSKSIIENKDFFRKFSDNIYVVSCGFKEFIDEVVKDYNIPSNRVFANTFVFDDNDNIIGFDTTNVLSKHNGKIECLKKLNLEGEVQVIGDGYSDYLTKESGMVDKFFAFTENVSRKKTLTKADHIAPNIDEFLYLNKLPRKNSFPKHRIKVLLLENIHSDAFRFFSENGFSVEAISTGLTEKELIDKVKNVHVLGIRSKTKVTRKVLEAAPKLMAIGAFCIGTKQIDLIASKENGVVVFNAPYSNTRSVVELAIGEIIMLMRSVFARSTELHQSIWNKTANGANEIRGKKLGIIGYGNIGKQLSVLAEAMGMKVYYYDIESRLALGNAQKCHNIKELLQQVDVVSLHVDDNPNNKKLIGKQEISWMKDGSILINLSRGFVVDIIALKEALQNNKLLGAAIDVFPKEPKSNGKFELALRRVPNVILTPHIGGSTMEAQKDIADFVPSKLVEYINSGDTVDAINFPNIRLPKQKNNHRFLHVHKNKPGVIASINSTLANFCLNVTGQYLATDQNLGYVIIDVNQDYNNNIIKALNSIKYTIKFRVLY